MKNLYNKIYKAINEGIQKALLIDPDQNDVSINYSYHKINNSIYSQDDFNKAVNEFNKNPNIANYDKVLKYSMHGIHQYKVNNFNELIYIFKKIQHITDNIDLSWIDTENVLFFITKSYDELSLNEINNIDIDKIVFIKFDNIEDINHPIIIHKNIKGSSHAWGINQEIHQIDVVNTINGYINTYNDEIKNNRRQFEAFDYCIKKSDILTSYDGYLPAINELKFLSDNIEIINYFLKYISNTILDINIGWWWSSTISSDSDNTAWCLNDRTPDKGFFRSHPFYVLPLFADIRNKNI